MKFKMGDIIAGPDYNKEIDRRFGLYLVVTEAVHDETATPVVILKELFNDYDVLVCNIDKVCGNFEKIDIVENFYDCLEMFHDLLDDIVEKELYCCTDAYIQATNYIIDKLTKRTYI